MQKTKQNLILLAFLLLLLLSYPVISAANRPASGIPPLYIYIFLTWLLAIIIAYLVTVVKNKD
ncbi:MAG: hypothetical protein WAT19_12460 [Ferruginibacter sp.]